MLHHRFSGCEASPGERVLFVTRPAAGEVHSHQSIGVADSLHENLRSIIHSRNAPCREQPLDAHNLAGHVFADLGKEAGHIVIVKKNDIACRVFIKEVIAQGVIQFV